MWQTFKLKYFSFLFFFIFFISLYSTAFSTNNNASDGTSVIVDRISFSGIEWGTKFSDKDGLKYLKDDSASHVGKFPKLYKKENEKINSFCNEKISLIRYGYNYGKFCKVIIDMKFRGDFNELKEFVNCIKKSFPKFKVEYKKIGEKNGFTPIFIFFKEENVILGDFVITGIHFLNADVDSLLRISFENITVQKE